MATFAIGDIHGQYDSLSALLDQLKFDSENDRLWCTGDLVNRGSESLQTLRYCRSLGNRFTMTLGNHDLSLIAYYYGYRKQRKLSKSTYKILQAEDADELIQWLSRQPFIHFDADLNCLLVHAGLPPSWKRQQLLDEAQKLHLFFAQSEDLASFVCQHMMGNKPKQWHQATTDFERYRYLINCLTRMRYYHLDGRMCFKEKGRPIKDGLIPWFEMNDQCILQQGPVIFGHWATLAYYPKLPQNAYHIDTACAYGGDLTALCLDGCQKRNYQPLQAFHLSCSI